MHKTAWNDQRLRKGGQNKGAKERLWYLARVPSSLLGASYSWLSAAFIHFSSPLLLYPYTNSMAHCWPIPDPYHFYPRALATVSSSPPALPDFLAHTEQILSGDLQWVGGVWWENGVAELCCSLWSGLRQDSTVQDGCFIGPFLPWSWSCHGTFW